MSPNMHHMHGSSKTDDAPPPFVASSAKPFAELMNDAMAVMDHGMRKAPMNGVAGHDFVTMMIPHHQGAIDMARILLQYGKDAQTRKLAQDVIAAQESEIAQMKAWLAAHPN